MHGRRPPCWRARCGSDPAASGRRSRGRWSRPTSTSPSTSRPRYVSRGGTKLANALDALGLDVADRQALDAGASTGGFTDVLLQRGAQHVVAVDVAYGELDWGLRNDDRVTVLERTNVARAAARPTCPTRRTCSSPTSPSSRCARCCPRCWAAWRRGSTRSSWSSRSSRWGGSASAAAAWSASRPTGAGRSSPSATAAQELGASVLGVRVLGTAGAEGQPGDVRLARRGRPGGRGRRRRGRRARRSSRREPLRPRHRADPPAPGADRGGDAPARRRRAPRGRRAALRRRGGRQARRDAPRTASIVTDATRRCPTWTCASRSAATARSCARCATYARTGVPVFAVNFGEVGFLATVDPDELTEGFTQAFRGEFERLELPAIEVRIGDRVAPRVQRRLAAPAHGRPRRGAVLLRSTARRSARCAPTGSSSARPPGSTGYNLANGGPVMAWGVEGFGVSFIAPHSLAARSLVVAPDDWPADPEPVRARRRPLGRRPARRASWQPGSELLARFVVRRGGPRAAARDVLLPQVAGEVRPAVPVAPSAGCDNVLQEGLIRRGAAGRPSGVLHRAPRREPPAHRAGRAAARARAQRPDGRDRRGQDRAGPCARPAARRQGPQPGIVRPGAERGVRRGRLRAAGRAARRAGRAPAGGRGGGRARAAGERRGAHARARERPLRLG